MISEPWKVRVRVLPRFRILCHHQITSAAQKKNISANFSDDFSISGRRTHHHVRQDLIYSPGGTPASTSDRRTSTRLSSLWRPPRAEACAGVGHFLTMRFHLKTRQPSTEPSMPLILPFDTCRCEFYSLLSSATPAFCSFCAIFGHYSQYCDS